MVYSVLGLLQLCLMLTISVRSSKRLFHLDNLLAFVVSPLLLIGLSSIVHNIFLQLNSSDSVTFISSSKMSLAVWLAYCLSGFLNWKTGAITRTINIRNNVDYSLFVVCLLSISTWFIGIGRNLSHPTDNDALSNAFLIRRFADTANQALCMVPGDVSRLSNLRFESCGAFVLARYSNLFGWAPWDKVLNSPYILSAVFLPLGAAASWKYFSGTHKHRWIAAATSTVFLVYPYALNGLSRLTLGLAFVLPLIGLCSSIEKRDSRQLLLISFCLVGLGYIHLLAMAIVLIYLAIVLVFKALQIPIDRSSRTSPVSDFFNLSIRASVVIPAYWVFGSNFLVKSSVSNVLSATEILPPSNIGAPSVIGAAFPGNDHFHNLWETMRSLFLGNDWTRAQPLIFLLFLIGIYLLLRKDVASVPLVLSGVATYFLFISVQIWDTHYGLYHFLFLNNWYRLFSVMTIFFIIPVALSISYFLSHFSKPIWRQLLICVFLVSYALSLATGASIVRTAWNRDSKPTNQVLEQFDGLRKFSSLRTLNNPADGSSWAYVRSGINLLSPNDRSDDMLFGSNISLLAAKESRMQACPFLILQEVQAILAVDTSLATFNVLQRAGVVDRVVYRTKDVMLGLISQEFLSSCRTLQSN